MMSRIKPSDFLMPIVYDPIRTASINVILGDDMSWTRQDVGRLAERKIITLIEKESLLSMLNSKDAESIDLAKMIIREKNNIRTFKEKLMFWKRV